MPPARPSRLDPRTRRPARPAATSARSTPPAGLPRAADPNSVRDVRRAQIIAAARRIVAEEGLEGLTIGSLEDRLSFTRGVITYHFKNKDEIVEGVFQSAIDEINQATRAAVAASHTPEEKVRAVLRATVRGFLEHIEAGRILLAFWGRIFSDRRARKINAQLYARYRQQAARLLEAGHAAGAFGAVPVDAVATIVVGMVLGIAAQGYFEPGAIDSAAAVDVASEMVIARLQAARDE